MNPVETPSLCKNCGAPAEENHRVPLCAPCRDRLSAHPIPVWLKVTVVGIAVVFAYAMLQFPAVCSAAIAYERGLADEQRAAYPAAESEYEKVVAAYPHADDGWMRLALASHQAGDDRRAVQALAFFNGRQLPQSKVAVLNNLVREIEAAHPRRTP